MMVLRRVPITEPATSTVCAGDAFLKERGNREAVPNGLRCRRPSQRSDASEQRSGVFDDEKRRHSLRIAIGVRAGRGVIREEPPGSGGAIGQGQFLHERPRRD